MEIKIQPNLFDLSPEEERMSKMIYNGNIVKCLVAPYHNYQQLEKIVPFTKTTYLFPEREVSLPQLKSLISVIAQTPSTEEFRIITINQNIILDMIDGCVRVLTEKGNVVPCPCKTFMANIHNIRYYILENKDHQISPEEKTKSQEKINIIIEKVNKPREVSQVEFDALQAEIDLIGEPIISDQLGMMIRRNLTVNGQRQSYWAPTPTRNQD